MSTIARRTRAHETQSALAVVELAIARADVALDAPVFQDMPITAWLAFDGLIHVLLCLSWKNGVCSRAEQDASGFANQNNSAACGRREFILREPDQLRVEVQGLLGDAGPSTAVIPKAVIAPHAGYVYSGRVAATAFATLRGRAQAIERVVLVGPAHYLPMRGIAAPTVDDFETPLGQTPVDAQRWPKLPICHLSFGATHRTRPSTRSKSSCRSCRCCCRRSELYRWSWAMRPRNPSPKRCVFYGAGRRR